MAMQESTTPRVRNRRAEIEDNVADGLVTFKFADGATPFIARLDELPAAIVRQLAVSRLHNKLMDSYADPSTDARHEAMSVYAELRNGVWSQRGEAGPKRPTLLIEALAEIYKKKPESVEKWLEAQSESDVAGLKKEPVVKAKIEEIKAKRQAEKARGLKKAAAGLTLATIDIPE